MSQRRVSRSFILVLRLVGFRGGVRCRNVLGRTLSAKPQMALPRDLPPALPLLREDALHDLPLIRRADEPLV